MCVKSRTMFFLSCLIICIHLSESAPSSSRNTTHSEVENSLEQFLGIYYDEYLASKQVEEAKHAKPEDDIYETMQGDQPLIGNNINGNVRPNTNSSELTGPRHNYSDQVLEATRNRRHRLIMNERSKENFIKFLKSNILEQLGRKNISVSRPDAAKLLPSSNLSEIMPQFLNSTNVFDDNDQITEKIRSFYPSCDVPSNTDQDMWKDDDIMNLFFNFDYVPSDRNTNIATATLRLYRLPENDTHNSKDDDCVSFNSTEDEKLLRVSIYWYTKSLKKRRVKRRLSDSKVIPEYSKWVELSVKPATKAWTRGKNLGLGVLVEDQEGNMLRADRYFKGASCMVGTSTPKPIPTIIIDAARQTNELNRIDSLLGRNSTSALYSDIQLLPTIDICTLEFPANYTQPAHIMNLRINACNLKKMHEQNLKLAEKDRLERLATLPEFMVPSSRHIRHQRQYLANKKNEDGREVDPRSRILGSTVLFTNEEWQNYTNNNKFNFSTINR